MPKFLGNLGKLKPNANNIVFCTNNNSDRTIDVLRKWKHRKTVLCWDAKGELTGPYDQIAVSRQKLLEKTRRIDVDYAVFLDDDIEFPSDLLEALTTWGLDIVGGSYLRFWYGGWYLASKWNGGKGKLVVREKPRMALDEVAMTGAGCMCLSRRVIQDSRLNFYPLTETSINCAEDFDYCNKARALGYKIHLDGITRLTHHVRNKPKPWLLHEQPQPNSSHSASG